MFKLHKKIILLFGLLFLSGLSIFYLFRRSTPSRQVSEIEQVRQTVVENPKSNLQKITSAQVDLADNNVIPEYPPQLPVYSFSAPPLNLLKETQLLAQKMGLRKHQKLPNYWVNETESQILYYDTNKDGIFYSLAQNPQSAITVDSAKLNQFISEAQKFAQNLFSPQLNSAVIAEIGFLSGQDELFLSTSQSAVRVLIPFTATLDSYSLKTQSRSKAALTISVDVNNIVSGFEYYPNTVIVGTIQKKSPTLSRDKIKYLIQGGAGKVSYLYSQTPVVKTIDSFDKIVLVAAVVEYHTDSLRGQIIPYLNFQGETASPELGDIKLNILLPLITLD